ncbi:protein translocase subunit SecD [Acidimicrobiia bacterium EGI L10123]|uniref:protein translocase subunit SecD n=1 Tax=Salinilacustrithrix flava TaxID=2957203 RepID=UPI003D7C19DF|nr:protein translocase subunit SecD [Acidimicrobiia bacterium EGI L10123]
MRRNGLVSLIFIVVLALGGLVWTFVADNEPLLGLDLQGGVSVVLEPTEDVDDDAISQAISIIRQRVDGIGVAEPEITRQDDAIVVQLPGIADREQALELVGQTAELRFRPVLQLLPAGLDGIETPTESEGEDAPEGLDELQLTPAEDDVVEEPVTLAQYDDDDTEIGRYRLGPAEATGEILSGASAQLQGVGQWAVAVEVRGDSIDEFNAIAAECFNGAPSCPTRQLAIVLDGRVVSAPSINAPAFNADEISISGDFTEGEAKDLALVLRYGSLPVELEAQQTQSISASIGQDALDAGVTAGIIGLAIVTIYMLVYYRLLGLVAMLSLSVSAALLWTMIAWLGTNQGLALTLAGVTGIILSIGVAVDSNVVFYEHLKEEVAGGRSLRAAVDGSFATAFSTIVKADVASLIGAAILYWLTVGPVRGFALFLGLSTLLDLIASYFFMRPLTVLLVKSKRLQHRPRLFGMPTPKVDRGLAIDEGAPA